MERLTGGYLLAEAPVAAPDGGVLFSDALGGGVRHWSPATGAVETVIPKRRGVGGMAVHADGHVVVGVLRFRPFACEQPVPGEFVRVEADGSATPILPGVDWVNGCAYSPDGRT